MTRIRARLGHSESPEFSSECVEPSVVDAHPTGPPRDLLNRGAYLVEQADTDWRSFAWEGAMQTTVRGRRGARCLPVGAAALCLAILAVSVLTEARRSDAAAPVKVLAAGDIASCTSDGDTETAELLADLPGQVLTLGDLAYEQGTAGQFRNCYNPTWGWVKSRTHPVPGNHEYYTADASGYFGYFGEAAGDPERGYYSWDYGGWHLVAINSNCESVGGCGAGSPQEKWLRWDLAVHPAKCTLAYWHHPRFSSGYHGNDTRLTPIWKALFDGGADVVLSGHDHDYERLAPANQNGAHDNERGIRSFVVGTGGRSHAGFPRLSTLSEARAADVFGVLELTLWPNVYQWRFVGTDGSSRDPGGAYCH